MTLSAEPISAATTLPDALRRILEARSWRPSDLAGAVGVHKSVVGRWLTGTAKPAPEVLEKLASLGLEGSNPEWSNIDSVPRNRSKQTGSRAQLGLLADDDSEEPQHERSVWVAGTEVQQTMAPYIANGPANQVPFFDELHDLQLSGLSLTSLNLDDQSRRYASVRETVTAGKVIETAQHLLERPKQTAAHWNTNYGSHGWHRYVGRFPAHLVRSLLNAFGAEPGHVVCDPFMGSGTTAVECRLLGLRVVGTDVCPLSALIARTKAAFPSEVGAVRDVQGRFEQAYDRFVRNAQADLPEDFQVADLLKMPNATVPTFSNIERWLTPRALLGTMAAVHAADQLPAGYARELVLVALSSKMRSIGNVDVDVVRAEYSKSPRSNVDVRGLVGRTLRGYAEDVTRMLSSHRGMLSDPADVDIRTMDARQAPWEEGSVSHIVTSPPYGVEAISYLRTHLLSYRVLHQYLGTDPYKFEAEIIGSEYVDDSASIKNADLALIGSPTLERFFGAFRASQHPRKLDVRAGSMLQFFHDMRAVIQRMRFWLRPGGRVALVIGNKKLGDEVVPTHQILTEIFEAEGFRADRVIQHKLKCNNTNSQVPWQERIIQDEYLMLFTRR